MPMANAPAPFENWRGMVWALFAALAASVMSIAVRGASIVMDPNLVVFYRGVFGLSVVLVFILASAKSRAKLRFSDPKAHILRGSLIGLSTLFGFHALATTELAAATVLFGLAPVFATLIAVLALGQSIGLRRSIAIAVSFLGAIIIIDPRISIEIGMLSAIGTSLFFGMALAMSRGLAQRDGAFSTLVSSLVMTLIIATIANWPLYQWPGGPALWFWLWVLVLSGLVRQFCDIESYRYGEAATLVPIFYLRLIFIAFGGYILFDEAPKINTWIGGAIVIAATVYMTYRERNLRDKPVKQV